MGRRTGRLLKVALALAILASTLTLFPRPAYACSCIETTLEEQADELDFAFVGHQIGREQIDEMSDNGVRLVFEVDSVYKGDIATPFEVFTSAQSSACGVSFGDNAQTGVVAHTYEGKPLAGLCSQLMDTSEAQMKAVFGVGAVPVEDRVLRLDDVGGQAYYEEESPPWLWIILASVAGPVAAVVFVARRTKRTDV